MKKVLIITYYWPPGGGGGVQRWLKFVKYLREFGWDPIIYTPENPEHPVLDHSLVKEIPEGIKVIKTRIWEPYEIYKGLTGKRKEKIQTAFLSEKQTKSGLLERMSIWIRGNLFIPDARKYWIKPSLKYLRQYLKKESVDAIVSTGPPHSMHLIASGLAREMGLPWLADFRDPWTNIDYYRDLKLGKHADAKHHKLERKVLEQATAVTVISPGMKKEFSSICERTYEVIPNGYDADDLRNLPTIKPDPEKFVIAHIGSLTRTRNPKNLWKALGELCEMNEDFKKSLVIRNVGKLDFSVKEAIRNVGLDATLELQDYLPHDEVLIAQREANVLLLLVNDTPNAKLILTGKIFEYLSAKRPIICVGPEDGDASKVISETGTGKTFNFDEVELLKKDVLRLFENRKSLAFKPDSKHIEKYERRELTKRMAQVLNSCIASPQGSGSQNS